MSLAKLVRNTDLQAQRDALAKVVRYAWATARESYDINAGDFQQWMTEAGLLEERPATAEQAVRYECEVGDPIMHLSALGKRALGPSV